MRMRSAFAVAVFAATLAGCANIPLMNNIPLWAGDREKIANLGKGAPAADVDKTFGHSRILWSKTVDEAGGSYLFRLYDSVEPTGDQRHNMEPYAVVFSGPSLRLHAWGTLSEMRDSADPAVAAMVPELTLHYTAYRREGR